MKKTIGLLLTIITTFSYAEIIHIPNTDVTFDAPENFTELTKEEVAIKFPLGEKPAFVIGNERGTTTIAYNVKPSSSGELKLSELLAFFENVFNRMIPGIVWIDKKLINKNNREWIYLELKSNALDTDIHNVILGTFHKGSLLLFNFNSTVEEFPKVEAKLRESIESIQIN